MGISVENLGRPIQAALASFVTFAIGAFVPLLPWIYSKGTAALLASVVLGAVAALMVGVVLAAFTERPMLRSALRQLAVAAVAAGVTYGVGTAIGAGVH
jgi:VIT1/CCC1 family predicted Fe2+/Mn2+ transporter